MVCFLRAGHISSPFRDNQKPLMGIDATKRWYRIGFYSSISPIEKVTASGCDETETIYVTGYGKTDHFAHNFKIELLVFKGSVDLKQ